MNPLQLSHSIVHWSSVANNYLSRKGFHPGSLPARLFSSRRYRDDPGKPFTAGLISISDKILSGEYLDENTRSLAESLENTPFCLKKTEVVSSSREEIEEAILAQSKKYDIVLVAGGISLKHPVKTYEIVAQMYGQELVFHQPTLDKMENDTGFLGQAKSLADYEARKKLALLPKGSKIVFPWKKHWGSVVVVNDQIHILSGVPPVFKQLAANYFAAPIVSFLGLRVAKHGGELLPTEAKRESSF